MDKMVFGILPIEEDFRIGDFENILAAMRRLGVSATGDGV